DLVDVDGARDVALPVGAGGPHVPHEHTALLGRRDLCGVDDGRVRPGLRNDKAQGQEEQRNQLLHLHRRTSGWPPQTSARLALLLLRPVVVAARALVGSAILATLRALLARRRLGALLAGDVEQPRQLFFADALERAEVLQRQRGALEIPEQAGAVAALL